MTLDVTRVRCTLRVECNPGEMSVGVGLAEEQRACGLELGAPLSAFFAFLRELCPEADNSDDRKKDNRGNER